MTAPDSLPLHALAAESLAVASPDLLRAVVETFADALMSAGADVLRNAEYGLGVYARRIEKLAESLGLTQLPKSQVLAMARHLDEQAAAFATGSWTRVRTRSSGWPR